MPNALPAPTSVAVVPCFNEGNNPADLSAVLLSVRGLHVVFVDDGSEGTSREVLDSLARSDARIRVVRNASRLGKVASLCAALRDLDAEVQRVLLVDCDVVLPAATASAALDELQRADLVLVDAQAMGNPRTFWEMGTIFSANRHARLRDAMIDRYPALCTNGRLLAMSRRLVDDILSSDVPRHTEDAHFMLVCLSAGYAFSYLRDAPLYYRAPDTLDDYLRQSNRFSEGRTLLAERWPQETLQRYYDPKSADLLRTFALEALHDPAGAFSFGAMLAAKAVQRGSSRSQKAAWSVAASTKVLR